MQYSLKVKVTQSDSLRLIVHGILQARILEWITYPSPAHLPDPGIELGVSCIAGGFFTS